MQPQSTTDTSTIFNKDMIIWIQMTAQMIVVLAQTTGRRRVNEHFEGENSTSIFI